MERAYRQGFEDAQLEPPANHNVASPQEDALEWTSIPPRPRNTFWTICLFSLGTENIPDQSDCYLIPVTTKRGTPGWQLIQPGRTQCNLIFGHQTFIPLARLGLFDYEDRESGRVALLSDRAVATWKLFREREELTGKS